MKKILFVITIALTLTMLFAFSASCEGVATEEAGVRENVFEQVYDFILLHSDKILSAAAAIGSLILAFAYKKGLLPILKGALSKLSDSISKLCESNEKRGAEAEAALEGAKEKFLLAEKAITDLTEKLDAFEKDAENLNKTERSVSNIESVILCQIDLLYEIFISSSLPIYQKEAVSEKISDMRKTLGKSRSECGDEEN